eukprot:7389971-Pyramimonas_sp.AAC.1
MVTKLLNKGFRSGGDCFDGIEVGRDEETGEEQFSHPVVARSQSSHNEGPLSELTDSLTGI